MRDVVENAMTLDLARAQRETMELSSKTGLTVRPEAVVADLSVGEAQRVEILALRGIVDEA